ncbi:hypothetical protein Cgig2_018399 [Carnegiea gigantea]|uniref:Uncharacterized protein n=1 Tax=Carnegiea gigantea TaxID=171969 RepID=A0A9Q1GS12_9CARY|nr:hypothetical protein Cgig2_018399 [Carnegiea gigantea]
MWEAKWIPRLSTFKIVTPHNPQFSLLWVGNLIDPKQRTWGEDMVNVIFVSVDADIIKRIPLSIHLPLDRVVWHYSSCEEITVRSAYHFIHMRKRTGEDWRSSICVEEGQWVEFITVAWSVWEIRNRFLFENETTVDSRALRFLHDYQQAQNREQDSGKHEDTGWRHPDAGICKLNFDAAKLGDGGHGGGAWWLEIVKEMSCSQLYNRGQTS